MNPPRVFAVILAAGQSRRMGRPKQLLPFRDKSMLDAVVDGVCTANDPPASPPGKGGPRSVEAILLVTNATVYEALAARFPKEITVLINDDPQSEMLASVQLALRWIERECGPREQDACLFLLGDQPGVSSETIAACAAAWRARPEGILIATYQGRHGHPTVIAWPLLHEVLSWPAERKLSDLAAVHPDLVRELPVALPAPLDVNTPEDLKRLNERP